MKQRIIWKIFLLEVVTLGIYRIYFLIKTRREMMDANPNIKIMSPAFLFVPVGVVIVALVFLVATQVASISSNKDTSQNCKSPYATSSSQSVNTFEGASTQSQDCSNLSASDAIGILVFYGAVFLAVILFAVWEWSYSQGVAVITQDKLSFAMSLIILLLVPDGIDILIIQDYFNKLNPAPVQAPHIPPFPPGPPAPLAA